MQIGFSCKQLRTIDWAFRGARDASHRRVDQFDQPKLDFIDRQRFACHRVEMADGIRGQRGFFADYRKTLVAAPDGHVKAGFDLADVLVEGTAQIGQQLSLIHI